MKDGDKEDAEVAATTATVEQYSGQVVHVQFSALVNMHSPFDNSELLKKNTDGFNVPLLPEDHICRMLSGSGSITPDIPHPLC